MLTAQDRRREYKAIEDLRRLRIENLRKLMGACGSWAELARRTGKAASNLTAIAGPNPCKAIGEHLARDLEHILDLPTGWLDEAHR